MHPIPLVAVASSAADPGPNIELLSALPVTWGEAFIFVQHFQTGRRDTVLHDALAKATSHPVLQARHGIVPEQGHVYVMCAHVALTIIGGRISVSSATSAHEGPADALFTSLAAERGAGAIGVVLSGGGSDGALGIQAIKKAGGITFAQYPGSARFPSMPISAIETGCVGAVLRSNEIAHELTRMSHLRTRPKAIENGCCEVSAPMAALPLSGQIAASPHKLVVERPIA